MAEIKQILIEYNLINVQSYINSGNLFFDSHLPLSDCSKIIKSVLKNYDFEIPYILFDEDFYKNLLNDLPKWWYTKLARRDVLFMTDVCEFQNIKESIKSMKLHHELVHFSNEVVFWGKIDEKEFLKTAYHRELMKKDFYKRITIRNGNTFDKIGAFLN